MKTKDIFISYGRRESLGFVGRLHQKLKLAGYDGWFDKVNIPDGDDYAQRINQGIESAHNFVYVMAPRCLTSPYCLIELEYARLLGKRVIPIDQMVLFETPHKELSDGDKQVLVKFYQSYDIKPDKPIKTEQDVLNRSHALLGKKDWLDAKEEVSDEECQRLVDWAKPYANHWVKHDDLEYLKSFEFPVFGKIIDELAGVVESIKAVVERQKIYVHKHTDILTNALNWQQNQKYTQHLLVGKERTAAEEWLLTDFLPPKQPPCVPSVLVCEFICEARKNAENMMTDIFICYGVEDKEIRDSVIQSLSRHIKTTWQHDYDIQKGDNYETSIEQGIETADNFFYFISPHSVVSDYCQKELEHALKYNKRIIPLLIAETPESDIPKAVRYLQYVDFTDNTCQADYDSDIDDILNIFRHEQEYYKQHKILLVRALKWQVGNYKSSFLLRGHNLDNAKTWLRLNDKRDQHLPLDLHQKLITTSEAAKGQLGTEVFISYSRKDADFARQLNTTLQEAGKTTWFDQESISTGVNFEKEIYKGIDGADNFVFVISPDAVDSEYCEREVNYASEQNKRFISVLHRETIPEMIPEVLRVINWIDFKDTVFNKSFPELIQSIELDREHAHQHTVLQQRASDWVENNRSGDFLLNITACDNAESWRDVAVEEEKQPVLTELQDGFIQKSRNAIQKANRRRNILFSFVGLLAIVAIVLAGFAFVQMDKAEKHKKRALVRHLGAQALVSAIAPNPSNGAFNRALLLAAKAFQEQDTVESRKNLLNVLLIEPKLETYLYGHTNRILSMAIAPNGRFLVTGSSDKSIVIWDIEKQAPLGMPLQGHSADVQDVAFSPDSKIIASASWDGTIILWDVEKQLPIGKPLQGNGNWVLSVAFTPDGKQLISGYKNGAMIIWDITTQKIVKRLHEHKAGIWNIAFSSDKKLFASAGDGVILWDSSNYKSIGYLEHQDILSIAFSPDNKILASASLDKTVRLWDIKTQTSIGQPLLGHEGWVMSVAFSPDGKILASASWDKTIRLWDIKTQTSIGTPLQEHGSEVRRVVFTPDCKLISADYNNILIVWDIEQNTVIGQTFPEHIEKFDNVIFSADGRLLADIKEEGIKLWDIETSKIIGELSGSNISNVFFSPNNKMLASLSDNTIKLWNITEFKSISGKLQGHTSDIENVAFSPDGQLLASASVDKTVRLWNIKTQEIIGKLELGSGVTSIAFSPDSKLLATGSDDNTIKLWSVKTQKSISESLSGHEGPIVRVVFSPNSKMLASISQSSSKSSHVVGLWDVEKQEGKFLKGHNWGGLSGVSFSPDGKKLVTGGSDKSVIVWDIETQIPIYKFQGHKQSISNVSFLPNGKHLISVDYDSNVILWSMSPNFWLEKACKIANRNLSQEELNNYLGNESYRKTCQNFPTDTLGALKLLREGEKQAQQGNVKKALTIFEKVLTLNDSLKFEPEIYAKRHLVFGLIEQGKELSKGIELEKAIAKFKEAKALNSSLTFDSELKAKKIFAKKLIEQGQELARKGKITEAIIKYKKAQQIDSNLEISANNWNPLCWYGSLYGQVTKVIEYCEKIVELAPENLGFIDSRALARALTGNIEDAIEDFKFVVETSDDEEYVEKAQSWLDSLQKGENPFTEEVLEEMR